MPSGSTLTLKRVASRLEELGRQLAPLIVIDRGRGPLEEALKGLEIQLKASEDSKIKIVAEYQNRLTAEKSFHANLREVADDYRRGVSFRKLVREPQQLRQLSRIDHFLKETEAGFTEAESIVNEINDYLNRQTREMNAHLGKDAERLLKALSETDGPHRNLEERIAAYVADLRKQGLATSIAEFNELSKQKSAQVAAVAKIDAQRPQLEESQTHFRRTMSELEALRAEITSRRSKQLKDLNDEFDRTLTQYRVRIVADESGIVDRFAAFVDETVHGTYMGHEVIHALCTALDPSALADILEAGDIEQLARFGLGEKWAATLLEQMGGPGVTLRLRTLWKPAMPVIRVWELEGEKREVEFSTLSDGQKGTVLLTVALLSDARSPLVIDQPEDDLDNRFIADTVVKTLRRVKERRQVILVTHNANIAVLGDSEQLLEMKRSDGGGKIASRGSIDDRATKVAVQDVLEGGRDALKRRVEIYG